MKIRRINNMLEAQRLGRESGAAIFEDQEGEPEPWNWETDGTNSEPWASDIEFASDALRALATEYEGRAYEELRHARATT